MTYFDPDFEEQEKALREIARVEEEQYWRDYSEKAWEMMKLRAKHPEGKGFGSVPKKKKRGGK